MKSCVSADERKFTLSTNVLRRRYKMEKNKTLSHGTEVYSISYTIPSCHNQRTYHVLSESKYANYVEGCSDILLWIGRSRPLKLCYSIKIFQIVKKGHKRIFMKSKLHRSNSSTVRNLENYLA